MLEWPLNFGRENTCYEPNRKFSCPVTDIISFYNAEMEIAQLASLPVLVNATTF